MSNFSAMLSVLVEANTRTATAALMKFDRQLSAIDRSSTTATTRTSQLGSASHRAGSALASAAKYAAGAAVAYLSISQAKAAITTTQDLTKATLGLQQNLGLSGRAAGEWAAEAQARGVATTQLGMAFKTLAKQVEAARGGSDTAVKMFSQLGVSMKEVNAGATDVQGLMLDIADGMDKAGEGTRRTAVAGTLFGRGWQGIAPLIRDGSTALKENLAQTEKYGAAIHGKTLADQEKLRQSIIESKIAWTGMQVTFTEMLTPALEKAHTVFSNLAAIMADKRLTSAEKFQKVGDIIGKWANKALDAFVGILPTLVSKAGEAAPKIAGALVEGFMKAPAWGKLALTGMLAAKLGLGGAALGGIGKLGTKVGNLFTSGWKASLLGTAGIAAVAIGAFEAVTTRGGIADTLKGEGATWAKDLGAGLENALKPAINKAMKSALPAFVRNTKKAVDAVIAQYKEMGAEIPPTLQALDDKLGDHAAKAKDSLDKIRDSVHDLKVTWADNLGQIKDRTEANMRAIEKSMGTHSERAKDELSKNYDAAIGAIRRSMDAGTISTKQGLAAIQRILAKQLKLYGVSPNQFIGNTQVSTTGSGPTGPGVHTNQRGGIIPVPGIGSGDKVPAMLEPGEVVVNRKAVAAMGGAARVHSLNSLVPRFAAGGGINLPRFTDKGFAASGVVAGGLNKAATAIEKAANAMVSKLGPSGGAVGGAQGPDGVGTYAGIPMANWVISSLKYAANKGVNPTPTSGYRSHAYNVSQGRNYFSEHEGTQYPHGAVDYGGYHDPVALANKMAVVHATSKFKWPLLAPIGFVDDGHASGTGHQRGGIIGLKGGGKVGKGHAPGSNLWLGKRTVTGRVSYFGGGTMASGLNTDTSPGIAMNIHPGTDAGWDNATTHKWLSDRQKFLVKIAGHSAVLPVLDLGPAGFTGRAIDVNNAGVSKMGLSGHFPTDAIGTATKVLGHTHHHGGSGGSGGNGHHGGSGPKPGPPVVGGSSGGTGFGAKGLDKLLKQIRRLRSRQPLLQERFDNAQTLDALLSSPAGSGLSPEELAHEVTLGTAVLSGLMARAALIRETLPKLFKGNPLKGRLRKELTALTGLTGKGGEVLQAKVALDQLTGSSAVDNTDRIGILQALLQQSNLRFGASQAQYGVLSGAMAKGGVAMRSGAYLVGERGPEVVGLSAGDRVTPGVAPVIYINGDIVQAKGDTRPPVEVAGARAIVKQGARGMGRRPLPGHRGH